MFQIVGRSRAGEQEFERNQLGNRQSRKHPIQMCESNSIQKQAYYRNLKFKKRFRHYSVLIITKNNDQGYLEEAEKGTVPATLNELQVKGNFVSRRDCQYQLHLSLSNSTWSLTTITARQTDSCVYQPRTRHSAQNTDNCEALTLANTIIYPRPLASSVLFAFKHLQAAPLQC